MPVRPSDLMHDDLTELAPWTATQVEEPFDRPGDGIDRVMRLAFEAMPHGLLVFDKGGVVLAANRAAETIFGYGAGELAGQPIDRLLPEASRDVHPDPWTFWTNPPDRTVRGDRAFAGVRRDGSVVPLEIGLKPLVEGQLRCVTAWVTDVTERLELQARLAAATSHSGFQRVLADLAAQLATAGADGIDGVIGEALRQVAQLMDLDQAILWRKSGSAPFPVMSYSWIKQAHARRTDLTALASIPFVASALDADEAVSFARVADLPNAMDRHAFERNAIRSVAMVPVALPEHATGIRAAFCAGFATEQAWAPATMDQLRLVSGVFSQALARKTGMQALQGALGEIQQLRDDATDETQQNRTTVKVFRTSRLIVSESEPVRRALAQVEQVASMPTTVLLYGETGAGKEVFAQAIHELSARRHRQMVRVSCAAIPSALIESELFGRERGAYTGALSRQIGRFEAANQSTLFLDEIGELSAEVQVKLLRVLQERVIERLGSNQQIKVDVRIIAATNRNLERAVEDKTFREDLFYRLNVFPIVVPPLRERIEDIPGLVWEFVGEFSKSLGKPIEAVSKETMRQLQLYSWPGNVRELRNVIERAVILSDSPRLAVPIPQPAASRQPQSSMTLRNLEIEHIRAALETTKWRIRGPLGAAERLGLKPTTLETRMAKLGLTRPKA